MGKGREGMQNLTLRFKKLTGNTWLSPDVLDKGHIHSASLLSCHIAPEYCFTRDSFPSKLNYTQKNKLIKILLQKTAISCSRL